MLTVKEKQADYWITTLGLQPHPEGGFFRETYRSPETIPQKALPKRFSGDRCFSTVIYFLLKEGQCSALHRIKSDEVWHFYQGGPLILTLLSPQGDITQKILGPDPEKGHSLQAVAERGTWFGAETEKGSLFSLMGCSVSPGFDFQDFEMAKGEDLLRQFPNHGAIIKRLTPGAMP